MRLFLLILVVAFAFGLPIILLCKWRKRTGSEIKPFLVGALTFFIMADLLEGFAHQLLLFGNNSISAFLSSGPVIYALYAGLMAGLFEECGRFIAFKTVLKKNTEIHNSVSYGIGHGGIEVILTLGAAYLIYLIAYFGGPQGPMAEAYNAFMSVETPLFFVAMLERISAMMLHIGLSIIVFIAANHKDKLWYFPAAIIIHALTDIPAALYQYGVMSILSVEIFAAAIGAYVLYTGIRLYRRYSDAETPELQ